jgi:mannosyltransferase
VRCPGSGQVRDQTEDTTHSTNAPLRPRADFAPIEAVAIVAICFAALGLRLYRLEFQSLWWDEGVSLYLATLPLSGLTTAKDWLVDLHPPLYHWLLGVWTGAAGTSPFAARYLSAWFGVAAVPLTYVLGRGLGSRLGGIVAAAMLAGSQFAVFYSQEARMYPLVAFLGLLSVWACERSLRAAARTADLALLAAVNLVGLYTYYYLGLLIVAEALVALVWLRRDARSLARWLAAQAACVCLFLPWAVWLYLGSARVDALGIPPERVVHWSLVGFALQSLLGYMIGFSRPAPWTVLAGSAALLAAGYAAVRLSRRSGLWWLLIVASVVSVLAAYAINLARPFLFPRFVIWVQPLLLVAVGVGVGLALREARSALGKLGLLTIPAVGAGIVALCALALVGFGNYRSLAEHYTVPRTAYSTSDYRTVLATMASRARPGDLVIGAYPWQVGYASAYARTPGLRLRYVSGESGPADAAAAARDSGRTWLLLYSADHAWIPDRVESELGKAIPTAFVDQYGDTRARLFAEPLGLAGSPMARLGDSVLLSNAETSPSALRAGGALDVVLTWQAAGKPAADYTVFVHLLGPDGRVRAQSDAQPVAGAFATSGWAPGAAFVDRHRLTLPADAQPGEYVLQAGMYLPSTGQRLPVSRSPDEPDRVILGRVTVVR